MSKTFHDLSTTSPDSIGSFQNARAKDRKVKAQRGSHASPDKGRENLSKISGDMTKTVARPAPRILPNPENPQAKPRVTAGQTPRGK